LTLFRENQVLDKEMLKAIEKHKNKDKTKPLNHFYVNKIRSVSLESGLKQFLKAN